MYFKKGLNLPPPSRTRENVRKWEKIVKIRQRPGGGSAPGTPYYLYLDILNEF